MCQRRLVLAVLGLCATVPLTESLECYSCSNVTSKEDCSTKRICPQGQKCYTTTSGIGVSQTFTLGCKAENDCYTSSSNSFVGRSIGTENSCNLCCEKDECNKNLCASGIHAVDGGGTCKDDPNFDCAGVSSVFNICADTHHAKIKCRKFCALCNLVDGGWSSWASWASCDVTCGKGHMTRSRDCSNPAPAHGGLDCMGDRKETGDCTLSSCPLHGGWSRWSPWGYCSTTCGVGFQRRDRSCSNPYPSPNGDHCYGDSRDDRPCFTKACADGVWSVWSDWGTCSATCLGGLQKRSRTCNNPAPTHFGHDCVGNSEEYQTCNNKECRTNDGVWSTWSDWSTCSATCLGGLQKRSRTCNNPAPTHFGHDCVGNSEEYQSCNNKECRHGLPVSFRAAYMSNLSGATNLTLIFSRTKLNEGGGYNNSTGVFTAPEPGVYSFTAQTCFSNQVNYYVYIVKDGHTEAVSRYYEYYTNTCNTLNAIMSLEKGNRVWVMSGNSNSFYRDSYGENIFQGVKINS